MIRIAIAAVLLAACGDPGTRCATHINIEVGYGSACVLASHPIAIDGDFSDWATIPPDVALIGGNAGDVQGVHATLTPDGSLAMYIETVGVPLVAAASRYRIELLPLAGPSYSLGVDLQPTAEYVELGTNALGGFPMSVAFGDTGIELAIPVSSLPFGGGLSIDTAALQHRVGGRWGLGQNAVPPIVYVCWDKRSPLCQPLYAPPP